MAYASLGRTTPAGRERAILFVVAAIAAFWLLGWGRAEGAGWLLVALCEARDGWRERVRLESRC